MNATKRITIDNTLDERLRLLEDRVRIFDCFHAIPASTNLLQTDVTRDSV